MTRFVRESGLVILSYIQLSFAIRISACFVRSNFYYRSVFVIVFPFIPPEEHFYIYFYQALEYNIFFYKSILINLIELEREINL